MYDWVLSCDIKYIFYYRSQSKSLWCDENVFCTMYLSLLFCSGLYTHLSHRLHKLVRHGQLPKVATLVYISNILVFNSLSDYYIFYILGGEKFCIALILILTNEVKHNFLLWKSVKTYLTDRLLFLKIIVKLQESSSP
jgi:hypothetical protein